MLYHPRRERMSVQQNTDLKKHYHDPISVIPYIYIIIKV